MENKLPVLFEGWITKRATDGTSSWKARYAKIVGEIDFGFMVRHTTTFPDDTFATHTNTFSHVSHTQMEWYKQQKFADNPLARPKGIVVVNADSTLELGVFRKKARLVSRRQVIRSTSIKSVDECAEHTCSHRRHVPHHRKLCAWT